MPEPREFKDVKLRETREAYVRVYEDEVIAAGDNFNSNGEVSSAAWEMVTMDSWEVIDDDWEIVREGAE